VSGEFFTVLHPLSSLLLMFDVVMYMVQKMVEMSDSRDKNDHDSHGDRLKRGRG
jgi:hypothetical protein